VKWILLEVLLEKARLRRTAYRSGRLEKLGIGTARDMIGFEKRGAKKIVPSRARPTHKDRILDRSPFRSKTSKSRMW